jgi:Ribonuclease G/E
VRRLYLDRCAGETRGVVTLDGLPERLLIERDGTWAAGERAGARSVARVARIERALGLAFLDLGDGLSAVSAAGGLVEGAFVEIEIAAEPRADKAAAAQVIGPSDGPPRLLRAAPDLGAELAGFAPGVRIEEGPAARKAADEAQEVALATEHPLPGGGSIAIESTRALTAVDVDLGARTGGDARRAARQANLAAIATAARLLRLKGLGGLVVIDLAGKGHDGAAMSAAAKAAFAPDGPEVSIGPISRFGLFELALPRRRRPALEILTADPVQTEALDLLRALEREGRASPGARLRATARPAVVAAAERHAAALAERLGPRFSLAADAGRRDFEVLAL